MIYPLLTHTLIHLFQSNYFQKFAQRDTTEVQTRGLVNVRKILSVNQDLVFVLRVILELLLMRLKQDVVSDLLSREVRLRIL